MWSDCPLLSVVLGSILGRLARASLFIFAFVPIDGPPAVIYGLAFYGSRHTLSILSFDSHRVLICFFSRPRKGIDMSDLESILPV